MGFLSAINPLLLWGSLAVASPIIIHLLSKRRFKQVRWAAMEFLLQADQQNRRRIRLEHLLLLFLRCLLILLIAALLARPIIDFSSLGAGGLQLGSREHLVLLDDSPSMGARKDNVSLFSTVRDDLIDTIHTLAEQRPQDKLTLYLMSSPDQPVFRSVPLSNADSLVNRAEELSISDAVGDVDEAIRTIEKDLAPGKGEPNKSILIFSDFRTHNWDATNDTSTKEQGALARIRHLSGKYPATRWQLAVSSRDILRNLSVTGISPPPRAIAAKVPATFHVTVKNQGTDTSPTGQVSFSAMQTRPLTAKIGQLEAGESRTVPFTYTFRDTGPVRIQAGIDTDPLPADDVRYFAANVTTGTSVLLVDGEQALESYNSETFYLRNALSPDGPRRTGYRIETISEKQLLDRQLSQYGLIIVANVFQLSVQQAETLATYVQNGGGLALFLGDQVQAESYNSIHNSHPELFPVKLEKIGGDPDMTKARRLRPEASNHPVLRVFSGENNPLLSVLKLFRWWETSLTADTAGSDYAEVLAYINGSKKHPAIIESRIGDGRILVFTIPADAEWSNWVTTPGYPVAILDTASHLVKRTVPTRQIETGRPLREPIDPSDFSLEATLIGPSGGPPNGLRARAENESGTTQFVYDDTEAKGFYKLVRQRRDGTRSPVLFAANIPADEGQLKRVSRSAFARLRERPNVAVSRNNMAGNLTVAGNRVELWRPLLLTFALILCLEQFAGWYFGRRRSFKT